MLLELKKESKRYHGYRSQVQEHTWSFAMSLRTLVWEGVAGTLLSIERTRKAGSTTAFQAFAQVNLIRRRDFHGMAYPIGVLGTPRHLLIGIDECGLWLGKKVRGFGKAVVGDRFRELGVYGHRENWTLIMTIDCSGRKWFALNNLAG